MPALAEESAVQSSDKETSFRNILEEPDQDGLLRMTKLVEHMFRVPIAYMALLGPDLKIVTRIGSGEKHWKYLQTYPLAAAVEKPVVWPDPSGVSAAGFVSGDLRFGACAPLRSSDGLDLGLLVIADVRERPDFSNDDHETLVELADVIARKMELRMIASQAREAELACREAERRFRNIADSAPVMIIYTAADGATSFVNKAWLEFTGRTMEEELEHTAGTVHPDYRKPVLDSYREALRNRQPTMQEFPMRRHDGVYRWMSAQGTPRFRDDGAYVGYVGCFVDITDQRAATLALHKQALCTAAIAEAAGAFFLILDTEGRVEQVSPLCRRTSARDTGAMCGRFIWKVCDAAMPGGPAIREAIRQAAATRQPVQAATSFQLPGGKGAAELHWTFTPVISEQNEVLGVAAVTFGLCAGPGCACGQR